MNPLASQSLGLQNSQNYPQTKASTSLNFIKNDAKAMFQRYTGSYLMYKAPEAISWVGRTIVESASTTASFIGSMVLNSENHIKYVQPPIVYGNGVYDTCDAPAFSFRPPQCALYEAPSPPGPIFKDAHTCAVFSALTVPVAQTISYCAKKTLGANQNTPIRNVMAGLVTFAATPVTTALLAQGIGYEIEPKAIVDQQVQGVFFMLKLGAMAASYGLGTKAYQTCYENFSKKFESIENETSREIVATLSSAATVGGAVLTSSLALGYSLGYSTVDVGNIAISLAKTMIPIMGIGYLAKNLDSLVKEASDTAFEIIETPQEEQNSETLPEGKNQIESDQNLSLNPNVIAKESN